MLGADIPLATPDAIAGVLAADADVALVPAQDGGTNALAMAPDAIPFLFGKDSARRHLDAARGAGCERHRSTCPSSNSISTRPPTSTASPPHCPREHSAARTTEALRELGLLHATAEP